MATTACWTHARSCLASGSVSPKSAMSWRLPGRPSSISSTLRVPPSARVSTNCNTKPIHDPPAGNGPAGHIAPSAHPQSLDTPVCLLRGDVAESGVDPATIVIAFDVSEQVAPCGLAIGIVALVDELGFQRAEEPPHRPIVPPVSLAAH